MGLVKAILLGHGHLGKWHAQKLAASAQAQFVGIVEPNTAVHSELQKLYPQVEVKARLEELTCSFDAALIASPTTYHFDLCRQLLERGKHIFCEKPVTQTHEEAIECQRVYRQQKAEFPRLTFQVGHSERFHAFFAPEALSEVAPFFQGNVSLRLERQAPFKGRATDVDVVTDLMIHDLDLLLYLTGERPMSIRSKGFKVLTSKWDVVESRLTFSSGKSATITVGRTYVKEVRFLEVVGEMGTLHFDLKDEKRIIFKKDAQLEEKEFARRDHLLIEQQEFFKAITDGTPEVVGLEDGVNAVYLVQKAIESLELGREITL